MDAVEGVGGVMCMSLLRRGFSSPFCVSLKYYIIDISSESNQSFLVTVCLMISGLSV